MVGRIAFQYRFRKSWYYKTTDTRNHGGRRTGSVGCDCQDSIGQRIPIDQSRISAFERRTSEPSSYWWPSASESRGGSGNDPDAARPLAGLQGTNTNRLRFGDLAWPPA